MVVAFRLVQVGGEHLKLDPRVDIFRMSLQPSGLGGESRVGLDHAFLEADSRGAEILLSAGQVVLSHRELLERLAFLLAQLGDL